MCNSVVDVMLIDWIPGTVNIAWSHISVENHIMTCLRKRSKLSMVGYFPYDIVDNGSFTWMQMLIFESNVFWWSRNSVEFHFKYFFAHHLFLRLRETQYFYYSVSSIFPEAWVWVYVSRIKWMCRSKVISLHRRFSTSLIRQQIISSKSKLYLSTMVIQQAKQVWKKADAVCFDVDSTVITDEGIDELAAFCGKGKEVSQWYVVMQLFQFIRTSFRHYTVYMKVFGPLISR